MSRVSITHHVSKVGVTTTAGGDVVVFFGDTAILLDQGHEYELLEELGKKIKERDDNETVTTNKMSS